MLKEEIVQVAMRKDDRRDVGNSVEVIASNRNGNSKELDTLLRNGLKISNLIATKLCISNSIKCLNLTKLKNDYRRAFDTIL
ncbi:hypothetical protein HHI36_001501 [Cryptolaemus montrouzieri]|uniref:Uncharacterized protein n=1 Tax=Cryptolaemus montrouzieri TaxID=559131 RepID=A0ABD2P955_9CUCU